MQSMHGEGLGNPRDNPYSSGIDNKRRGPRARTIMFSLISLIVRAFRPLQGRNSDSPASALMESADSSVGRNPHHAHELREAASAWLRVVR